MCIRVRHTSSGSIANTGDVRFHGRRKKDTENFTKYVEDKNERGNKKDSDIIIAKK